MTSHSTYRTKWAGKAPMGLTFSLKLSLSFTGKKGIIIWPVVPKNTSSTSNDGNKRYQFFWSNSKKISQKHYLSSTHTYTIKKLNYVMKKRSKRVLEIRISANLMVFFLNQKDHLNNWSSQCKSPKTSQKQSAAQLKCKFWTFRTEKC